MISQEIIQKIKKIQIFSKRSVTNLFAGEYESAFKGKGIEFEEVREYFYGDDVRSIDWNVTAKTGIPHIKRYKEERELIVYFLVDFSASGHITFQKRSRNEFAAEIVTVLSFVANMNNDRTGMLVFTENPELYITPAKGMRHILRMTRDLLVYNPVSGKTSIANALRHIHKVETKRSVIFLLSDFYDTGWESAMKLVARKHDLVNIVLRDKRELELADVGLIELQDPESGSVMMVDTTNKRMREDYGQKNKDHIDEVKRKSHSSGADFLCLVSQQDWLAELGRFFRRREGIRK